MTGNNLITRLQEEVEQNLQNEQFGVEELASSVGMSRSNLHRKLQESTGQSVSQFIQEYRLEKAIQILKEEDITASEVAYRVGFGSATYFSTSFTEFFGYPPGEAKKRAEEVPVAETRPKKLDSRPPFVWYTVVVVIAGLAYWLATRSNDVAVTSTPVDEEIKSIAVLPFKNLSVDQENQYFADGVMDAILNKLAKVGEMSVTSRTSVEKFRDVNLTIPEIASELNVAYILEGSAQKYGDDIKITTQLIRAHTDDHLWSEEYIRKFEDVLSLQGEIAGRVADELHAVLTAKEKEDLRSAPTTNPEAYDYYLLADFQFDKSTAESLGKAIELYEQAIEIDPLFVDAYVGLAQVYSFGGLVWGIYPENEAWNNIERLLSKALEIDSLNGRAYGIMANALFYYKWNFKEAESYYDRSVQYAGPGVNADYYIKMGYLDRAQKTNNKGLAREPRSAFYHTFKAEILFHLDQEAEAIQSLDHAYTLFDDHYFLREAAKLYYNFGEKERSREIFEKVKTNFDDRPPLFYWLEAVHAFENGQDTGAPLNQLNALYENNSSGSPAWFLAMYYAVRGDKDQVFQWLEESFQRHEVEMTWLKMEPLLRGYQNEPQYLALMEKMSFPG